MTISELGEVGVSRAARVFNGGLLAGGLLLLPYTIGLGLAFRCLPGWVGTAAGGWMNPTAGLLLPFHKPAITYSG